MASDDTTLLDWDKDQIKFGPEGVEILCLGEWERVSYEGVLVCSWDQYRAYVVVPRHVALRVLGLTNTSASPFRTHE